MCRVEAANCSALTPYIVKCSSNWGQFVARTIRDFTLQREELLRLFFIRQWSIIPFSSLNKFTSNRSLTIHPKPPRTNRLNFYPVFSERDQPNSSTREISLVSMVEFLPLFPPFKTENGTWDWYTRSQLEEIIETKTRVISNDQWTNLPTIYSLSNYLNCKIDTLWLITWTQHKSLHVIVRERFRRIIRVYKRTNSRNWLDPSLPHLWSLSGRSCSLT